MLWITIAKSPGDVSSTVSLGALLLRRYGSVVLFFVVVVTAGVIVSLFVLV